MNPNRCQPFLEATVAITAVLLAGCAPSALTLAPDRPDRPWSPAVNSAGEIVPSAVKAMAPPATSYVLPANPALAELPASADLDPAHAYSLAELIDMAQSNSPATRIAWDAARTAALEAGAVHTLYLPQVRASAVGGYRTTSGHLSALDEETDSGTSDSGIVTAVSLQWLLFDFGERRSLRAAAQQQAVVADIAFTAAHQKITHAVAIAYYEDAAARARVGNAECALTISHDLQAAAEDRLRRGVGTVMEVAEARQGSAQTQLFLVQARAAASDARLGLITAIGVSPFTRLKVADVSRREFSPEMADLAQKAVGQALSRRPDMLAALAAQTAARHGIDAARAEFMPKVFTSATASYNHSGLGITAVPGIADQLPAFNVSDRHASGTVLVGVSVPLFDGGLRSDRLRQAEARADSAAATLVQTRDQAVLEIVTSENTLRSRIEALQATRALSDAARTNFDAALAAYRNGVGPITDVNLAQQQLLAATNASTDAYSAILAAAASLALATGSLGEAPE